MPGRFRVSISGMLPAMANCRSSNIPCASPLAAVAGSSPLSDMGDGAASDGRLLQQWQELMVVGRNGSTSDQTQLPGPPAGVPGGAFGAGASAGRGNSSSNYALPFLGLGPGPNGAGGPDDVTAAMGAGMGMGQRSGMVGPLVESLFRRARPEDPLRILCQRGLRVRIGMHTGLSDPRSISVNKNSGHT